MQQEHEPADCVTSIFVAGYEKTRSRQCEPQYELQASASNDLKVLLNFPQLKKLSGEPPKLKEVLEIF